MLPNQLLPSSCSMRAPMLGKMSYRSSFDVAKGAMGFIKRGALLLGLRAAAEMRVQAPEKIAARLELGKGMVGIGNHLDAHASALHGPACGARSPGHQDVAAGVALGDEERDRSVE